jgi:predicted CopG family antitoxin
MTTKTPTKVVTIEMTEHVYEKINDLRGGVTISDYILELINEHLKKQKPIPPEVIDRALID